VSKPDPAFYGAVLAACGCAPDEAVMVGDSLALDVRPAQAAGMRAVWYCVRGDPSEGGEADETITDLRDLPVALARLDAGP